MTHFNNRFMKKLVILFNLLLISLTVFSQKISPDYDSTLAKSFGGDDYGMKKYVLVILKTGSNPSENKALRDSIFRGHLKNIGRLADAGKLIIAGPLGKNEKTYRGIFILNVQTLEDANELLQSDPAVQEKYLEAELFIWYGSAALPDYLKTHKKIEKYSPG